MDNAIKEKLSSLGVVTDNLSVTTSVWDVLAGKAELLSEVQDFPQELDENLYLRAAATLCSLSLVRTELERIPETAAMGSGGTSAAERAGADESTHSADAMTTGDPFWDWVRSQLQHRRQRLLSLLLQVKVQLVIQGVK